MRAAVYHGPRKVGLRELSVPEPGPGEALVRVRACGICGSDLHRYRAGGPVSGFTPGHEIAGRVARLGPGVDGWGVDTPVVVEPLVTCRACPACVRGDYQICPHRVLLGAQGHGGLADYVLTPAYALYHIPPGLDWPVAALAEPMAVAVHGARLAAVATGERVLVLGSGTIGLLSALVAAEAGAHVTATARYPHQAAMAARCGAARVIPADQTRELAALARADPFDVVIETVGGEADTLIQAPEIVRPSGRVCVLGVFLRPPPAGALALVLKEVRMIGAITYGRAGGVADFDRAVALIAAHRGLLASLVTHRRPLDAVAEAYAIADDKTSRALKVTVEP